MASSFVRLVVPIGFAALAPSTAKGDATAVDASVNASGSWQRASRRLTVTPDIRDNLLRKHNELRAGVTEPCTAADMEVLVWDDSLAAAAEDYAAQCVWGHDAAGNRANKWGENIAMQWNSYHDWSYSADLVTDFVQSWYDEIVDAVWTDKGFVESKTYPDPQQCKSPEGNTGKCMVGHYTQLVWASTNRIGCGVASCGQGLGGDGGVYLVCKYSPPGNVVGGSGELPSPYTVGATCAECSGSCSGNLCSPGSTSRCEDRISHMTMNFNGVEYTDCPALIAATEDFGDNYWCSVQDPNAKICELSCGACSVPSGLGKGFCGQIMSKAQVADLRGLAAVASSHASAALSLLSSAAFVLLIAFVVRSVRQWKHRGIAFQPLTR